VTSTPVVHAAHRDDHVPPRSARGSSNASHSAAILVVVASSGFAGGVSTAYAQGWLPAAVGPLANSSGPWALVAFGLALLSSERRFAALHGTVALGMLLVGYIVASDYRGFAASHALIVFWGVAALAVGPLLGTAASWVRTERGVLAGIGAGAISGVLVGEGAYGLAYIAGTTSPHYWWCEIALSALLLGATATFYRWRAIVIVAALGVATLTATLLVMAYREDLINVLH